MQHWSFLTLAFLGLSGCVSASVAEGPASGAGFEQLYSGQYLDSGGFTGKSSRVFTSQEAFESALALYTSAAPAAVDFSASKVLLVDMGQRPSGGHAIGVVSVEARPDSVVAKVRLTKPGPNCMVAAVLTNPYQFVQIFTNKEVLVEEELVVTDCAP